MKLLRAVIVISSLIALWGCPAARPSYLAQPEVLRAEGSYIHAPSGMSFPATVSDFQRERILRYDTEGRDISAGYNLLESSRQMVATIYVYPGPSLISIGSQPHVIAAARDLIAQNEFNRSKAEILQWRSTAKVNRENEVSITRNGKIYPGKVAVFEYQDVFNGYQQNLISHLYLFPHVGGKWLVKYRFTHPRAFDATKDIEVFLQDLKWSIKGS